MQLTITLTLVASAAAYRLPVALSSHAAPLRPVHPRTLAPSASLVAVGSGLFAAAGGFAVVSPASNLKAYGLDEPDTSAQGMMRVAGAWQLCLAACMLAGQEGGVFAAGFGLFAAALTNLALVPTWSSFGRDTISMFGGCALFVLLGTFTLSGPVTPLVAPAIYLLLGLLIHFTPKETAELYQVPKPLSPLGYSMLALSGSAMATTGSYLAALEAGLAQPVALAAVFVVNALFSLKWAFTEAGKLGAPKTGPLGWAVISAAIAAFALV